MIEVKKVTEKWEIQDKEEKAVKSKEEAKKLVPQRFHKQIYIFEKKVSKRIPIRGMQYHVIDVKEEFVLRKEKVYLLLREKKEEIYEFIKEQLRKKYIRPSKLL